jgi:alpha,alpha-trehalase
MQSNLDERATQILIDNDRGGYTIPTPRLYPYQWNWDSAFAALGFSVFNRRRAWLELETLFEGQWADGMVPHIIFRRNNPDYFPGPEIWQSGTTPPSSGHSQPPVVSSIVRHLVDSGDVADRQRAELLFHKIFAWHNWYHTMRDVDGIGLVGIVHPWESGRDNCPDWDLGLDGIDVPADLDRYERRDTDCVDADERPTSLQYDRYLTIVKFGRECGWDHHHIARDGPFFMADPGIQFILMRADRDLLALAEQFGFGEQAQRLRNWIARSVEGCQQLWNDDVGAYCARDLKTGCFSKGMTSVSMLAFYAGAGTDEQRARLIEHAHVILQKCRYGFPSWDPRSPTFEPKRYWRGPVWAVVNYMMVQGLEECGETALAERMKSDTLKLIETSGFHEYFDPMTGEGLGGTDFTWTAAIHLAWSKTKQTSQAA